MKTIVQLVIGIGILVILGGIAKDIKIIQVDIGLECARTTGMICTQ